MDSSLDMQATIDMNGDKITSVGTPTVDTDAANKTYVDTAISSSGSSGTDFVASGTLPNGVPVILNSDGTVSHINTIGSLESIPKGTETDAGFGNITYPSVAYDPHTAARVVLTWRDNGLFAAVGTISGTTVTFGTKVRASSGSTGYYSQVHFDPVTPNSFAVIYRGGSNYGTMIAGTISGTTVTFGSQTVFLSTTTNDFDFAFDPSTSGSFVVSASSSTGLKVYAGTLSGTTLTFGTPVTAKTGDDFRDISVAFDSSIAGNYVLSYENMSTYPNVNFEILAGTVSGTTATTGAVTLVQSIGNGGLFDGNQIFSDSNVPGKFIMAYRYGPSYARVCTVSGNTFTFGTAVQISTATPIGGSMFSSYNSSLSSLISTAYYNSNFEMTVSTVSGMTITPATPIIVAAGNHANFSLSFDTYTSGRFIAFYRNRTGSPNYGATLFGQLATVAAPNLTTETAANFIGISSASYADGETATVTLAGSVSDNQTGLTTNSTYYVQTDGTLTTTAGTPSVEAGRAISSTSLLLTSDTGPTGATGATGGFTEDYVLAEDMAAGSVAVINSLGKVESVTGVAAITASYYENATHTLSTNIYAQRGDIESDPLNDNRFAIVQANDTGCRITVATVSGTTITWGTTLLLKGGSYQHITPRISWDSNTASGRLAVYYTDYTGGVFSAYLSVVTVSGTTCTEQSQNMVGTGIEFGDLKWVPGVAGRLVYTQRDAKTLVMYNVSATHQTTYNSQVAFGGLDSNPARIMFFPDDGTKVVLMYGTSSGIAVRIATISSSAITLGTEQVITGASSSQGLYNRHGAIAFPYNDSSKVVFASEGIMAYNQYSAVAATISGDTFTFGDIVLIDTGGSDYSSEGLVMFNPFDSTNIIVSTNISAAASNFQVLELTGTTLVKQLATVVATQGYSLLANLNDSGKFVMFRMDAGSAQISSYGVTGSTTLTSGKVAGLLTTTGTAGQTKPVQFIGRLDGFTGLTIGAEYYAQPVGGISTVNSIGSVLIGFAASETAIQIK